jgi:hypothetical protein
MIEVLMGAICLSLFLIFCFRNFFIQLVAFKLLVDAVVLSAASLRAADASSFVAQTAACIAASLGAIIFFVLLATGIQQFSKSKTLDMDAQSE